MADPFEKNKSVTCPYCNSDNWYKTRKPGWSLMGIVLLLFGFTILFPSKWKHCFDCDKDFKA